MAEAQRHRTLDIVRGVAVIGILVVNIGDFALPSAARLNPTAWGGTDPLNLGLWALNWVAFDNKMRGLFSLLFGASLLLVADRARASGRARWAVQGPRLLVLLVLGAAHYVLLWDGDILMLYALVGLLALPFVEGERFELVRVAAAAFAVSALLRLLIFAPGGMDAAEREPGSVSADLMAAGVSADLAAAAGGYALHVSDRLHSLPSRELGNIVFAAPDTLGLMMIGMLLLRSGLLTGRFERSEAWRLTRWNALAAGVPLLVLATWLWAGGFPTGRSEFVYFLIAYPFNIALTVAWAAGLAAWASAATGWLARALEATGRAAFTNYMATSLVMTTLFYGYGGGLFGQANRWQAWLFVLCGAALMLAWSRPWLTPLPLWSAGVAVALGGAGTVAADGRRCFGAPMLRRLYDWTLAKAAHPLAERWLAGLSFAESSVFPIPPDIILIPMCLADPRRAWRYAAICTVASVAGRAAGLRHRRVPVRRGSGGPCWRSTA